MKKELTPRKRQAIEMRAKIQSAALTLFNREGFENVSVEEIAQTVGCSVGNIYHYFKSKDELAIQVTQMVDEAYTALEEEYLADRETSGREKLLDFVGRSLEISASDEMLYKAFIHGLRYPEQAVLQKNDKRVYYRLLRELVGCVGMKTGYTKAAGRTLVSCVEREGRMLVAVTLQDGNDWADHAALYAYGFGREIGAETAIAPGEKKYI